jgi:hypothetical protein
MGRWGEGVGVGEGGRGRSGVSGIGIFVLRVSDKWVCGTV